MAIGCTIDFRMGSRRWRMMYGDGGMDAERDGDSDLNGNEYGGWFNSVSAAVQ